jgi:diphthine synthase
MYLIGLGLSIKDVTAKGLEAIKKCDKVYADAYTSILVDGTIEELCKFLHVRVEPLQREKIESNDELIKEAKEKNIALLVIGDPLTATTHMQLILDMEKQGIKTEIIHGVSAFTSVAEIGIQLYKLGRNSVNYFCFNSLFFHI